MPQNSCFLILFRINFVCDRLIAELSAYMTTNNEAVGSGSGTSAILKVDYMSTQPREDNWVGYLIEK